VFVFGWVGYQGSRATRRLWFGRGRAGVGIFPSARGGWLYYLVSPVPEPVKSMAKQQSIGQIDCPATIDHIRSGRDRADMIAARALDWLTIVIWFPLVESSPFHYRPSAYDNSPAAAEGLLVFSCHGLTKSFLTSAIFGSRCRITDNM
jgi:hypothetical protein